MDKIKCKCGNVWKIQDNLSAYAGEIVLVCDCGERYFNAQDFFNDDKFVGLEHVKEKGQETGVLVYERSDLLCPLDSICSAMVFSSKDWGIDKADAWIYGIAVGWDNEALVELKKKFNWSNGTIDRLKILHNNFKKLRT